MKKQKGITLMLLIILIVVISIITAVVISVSSTNLRVKNLNNMYTDIKNLNDRVFAYYNQYGQLPILSNFTGSINYLEVKNPDDDNIYYVIDISKLNNLVLTRNLTWTSDDVYIINNKTHTIYYPKGVILDDYIYYTIGKSVEV